MTFGSVLATDYFPFFWDRFILFTMESLILAQDER